MTAKAEGFFLQSIFYSGDKPMNVKKNFLLTVFFLLISIASMKEVIAFPTINKFYNISQDFEEFEKFCVINPEEHNYVVVYDFISNTGIHKYCLYDHENRREKNLSEYDCLKSKTIESYSNQTQNGIDFIMIKCTDNSTFAARYSFNAKCAVIEPMEESYGTFDLIKSRYGLMLGKKNGSLFRIDCENKASENKLSENNENVIDFDFIDSTSFWYSFKNDSGKNCLCYVTHDVEPKSFSKYVYSDLNLYEIKNVYSFRKSGSCWFSVSGPKIDSEKYNFVCLKISSGKNEFLFERDCDDIIDGCEIFDYKEKIFFYLTTVNSATKKKRVFIGNENCTLYDREVILARLTTNKTGEFYLALNETKDAVVYKVDFDKISMKRMIIIPDSLVVGDYCSFKENFLMFVESENSRFKITNLDGDILKLQKIYYKADFYNIDSANFFINTLKSNISITQKKRFLCGRYVLIDFGHHVVYFDTKDGHIDYFSGSVLPISMVNSKVYVVLEHNSLMGYFDFGEENLQFYYHYNEFGL